MNLAMNGGHALVNSTEIGVVDDVNGGNGFDPDEVGQLSSPAVTNSPSIEAGVFDDVNGGNGLDADKVGQLSSPAVTNSPSIEAGRARRRSKSLDFSEPTNVPPLQPWSHFEASSRATTATSSSADFENALFLPSHGSMATMLDSFQAEFDQSRISSGSTALQIPEIVPLLDFHCRELEAALREKNDSYTKLQEIRKLSREVGSALEKKKAELGKLKTGRRSILCNKDNTPDEHIACLRQLFGHEAAVEELEKLIEELQAKLNDLKSSVADSYSDHHNSSVGFAKKFAPYQDAAFEQQPVNQMVNQMVFSAVRFSHMLLKCREANDTRTPDANTNVTG